MNTKKMILSVVVAFVLSNALTTAWYMATDDANFVPYRRAQINYAGLMLNHLVYALIFVYLIPFYLKSAIKVGRGFVFGVLMAAMMFLPQAMVVRSIWKVDFDAIFALNSLAHLVIGGIIGVVVTLIYKPKKQTT